MRRVYLPLADIALIYDNSDAGRTLIAEKAPDTPLQVRDPQRWQAIEDSSQ
jgi:predicted ABC-type ATPase